MTKVKKILIYVLCTLILLNSIMVFAEDDRSLSVTTSGETTVNVCGISNPNTQVSLQVLRLGEDETVPYLTPSLTEELLSHIDSVISSNDGSFSFEKIEMGMVSGKYLFRVNDIKERTPQEFIYTYRSPLYVQEIIGKYNDCIENEDSVGMGDIINNEQLALLPDEKYFAEAIEKSLYSAVCDTLIKLGKADDRPDFQNKFMQAIMLTYFNELTDLSELKKVIEDCCSAAGFADKAFYKKTYLETLPDNVADGVISALADIAKTSAFNSADDFENMFFQKIITVGLKECSWSVVKTIIEDNGQNINSDTYDEYISLINKDEEKAILVVKELTGKTFDTLKELDDAWIKAIKVAKSETTSSGGSGSSGGGGGGSSSGGGGFKWITPQTEPETPESIVEVKRYFDDLDSVSWAEDSINALAERGVLNGKSERMFFPNDNITRAEFIKMLIAALEITDASATCDFIDVDKQDWYYTYVATGFKLGIASGVGDGRFEPQKNITRQDLCVLAYNAYKMTIKEEKENITSQFADWTEIADYAKEAVDGLCDMGVVNGVGDNLFKPEDNATRAQAAKIINNIADVISRGGLT